MAVKTAVRKIQGTIAAISQTKAGTYGPYKAVLIESPDLIPGMPAVNEPGKLWKSMSVDDAAKLDRGMVVKLVPVSRLGRETWDVEIPGLEDMEPAPTAQTTPQTISGYRRLSDDTKRAMGAYVGEMAKLYAFCRQQALEAMPGAPDEAIQACASSLFISTQRKFDLA